MVSIKDSKVILRDFIESDIEKRILWETKETEWQCWDAPWEYELLTDEQKQIDLEKYIDTMKGWVDKYKSMLDTETRCGFQICTTNNDYIGWCNSYRIDDNYTFSSVGSKCAIGINIPETTQRGKRFAFHALCLLIDYLIEHGEHEIYTQTWSGNVRMITLAEKLGFVECCRKEGIRHVRGSIYDALTFRLDKERYAAAKQGL